MSDQNKGLAATVPHDGQTMKDIIKEAEIRGFMRAVELLRSKEAIIESAYKTEPEQWADWLEARKP